MSVGTIALATLFLVLSVLITGAVYYLVTGDYFWGKNKNADSRNWSPPH